MSNCDRHVLLLSSPPLSLPAALRLPLSLSLHLPNDMWVAVSISVYAHPPRVRRCAGSALCFASQERQKFILNESQWRPSEGEACGWKEREEKEEDLQQESLRSKPSARDASRNTRWQSERRRSVASERAASILRLPQTVANACCQLRQCENSKTNEETL